MVAIFWATKFECTQENNLTDSCNSISYFTAQFKQITYFSQVKCLAVAVAVAMCPVLKD